MSGGKSWFESLSTAVQAAIVTASATILAALVAGVFAIVAANHSTSSSSAPPASASPVVGKPAPVCTARLRITSPTDGVKVSGPSGVLVKGEACDLANEDGWLFDFDYSDQRYHEDYYQQPGPVVLRDGSWTFLDQPLGSKGDVSIPYSVTLVLANQKCNAELLKIKAVGGDYSLRGFPPGCQIADSRDVYGTWR